MCGKGADVWAICSISTNPYTAAEKSVSVLETARSRSSAYPRYIHHHCSPTERQRCKASSFRDRHAGRPIGVTGRLQILSERA